ncbi:hypothetical protein BIT28_16465 [Photobacterium proteolyticum]|uniref:Uncharacterized protein n=1 Tax=Photobacterium proteolyticum TaxID=1903952 RepID=A0A1Q9G7L8_9GAMM|nr:hypothetical protein [Photobacterium proteolyticum]OLQ70318.1 hypothetical protein BIT28_16465 [Photobacterium proteolyticum]
MILQPNSTKRIGVAKHRWLIVREAQEYFYVQSDNGEQIRVDGGDKLDIENLREIDINNPHSVAINVVFQLTMRDIETTPPVTLKMADSMAVSEVRSTVNTREVSPQSFTSPAHITIEPNKKKRLCMASASRREIFVQNISSDECEALIGDQSVSAVSGLSVTGDRQTPAGMTITCGAELWAFNNGSTVLKLALSEVHN